MSVQVHSEGLRALDFPLRGTAFIFDKFSEMFFFFCREKTCTKVHEIAEDMLAYFFDFIFGYSEKWVSPEDNICSFFCSPPYCQNIQLESHEIDILREFLTKMYYNLV